MSDTDAEKAAVEAAYIEAMGVTEEWRVTRKWKPGASPRVDISCRSSAEAFNVCQYYPGAVVERRVITAWVGVNP